MRNVAQVENKMVLFSYDDQIKIKVKNDDEIIRQ